MNGISHIIASKLLKILGEDEERILSEWKKHSSRNEEFLDGLEKYWETNCESPASNRLNSARERLHSRIFQLESGKTGRPLISYFLKIAAAILILISVSGISIYLTYHYTDTNKTRWLEISTEAGQRSKVTLPDGSLVWLNAETTIRYRPDKEKRNVFLSGEAYFVVKHTGNYPFVVETGNTQIEVLGTKFDVTHYPDSKQTTAALLSGKITMTFLGKKGPAVELCPGEKIIYQIDKNSYLKTKFQGRNEILWKKGILVFDNEPFEQLIKKLERYYAMKILYNPAKFKDIHYTGTIDNLSFTRVFDFINLTIPISYEVNNKTITLRRR